MKTAPVSTSARAAGVVGLCTTVISLVAAFLPTADVTRVLLFETKLIVGVVGPTALEAAARRSQTKTASKAESLSQSHGHRL